MSEDTIEKLTREAANSSDDSERKTLEQAASILKGRKDTLNRGPAGAPVDDKLTR